MWDQRHNFPLVCGSFGVHQHYKNHAFGCEYSAMNQELAASRAECWMYEADEKISSESDSEVMSADDPQLIVECTKPVNNLVKQCIHLSLEGDAESE